MTTATSDSGEERAGRRDAVEGLTDDDLKRLRSALLAWFDRHRRELPWRGVDDPYAVWVSEVMLQQTQVATVIDYFRRWMQRFPTVEALAEAERDEVMELWAGLGYYRRARFLHESARMVVDQMQGRLPQTADALEELKGVGPYTAGAVASIAFDEPTPVVDGNVERVLSRLFAIPGDPKATENQKRYWRIAAELVDPERPGDFNQAMMELGATICTPDDAACMLCPARDGCRAFAEGDPLGYPDTVSRAPQKPMTVETAVVVRRRGDEPHEFLTVKRPSEGLLAGLWEFPSVEIEPEPDLEGGVRDFLSDRLALSAAAEAEPTALGEFVHHFSHIRMTIRAQVRAVGADAADAEPAEGFERPVRWVTRRQLDDLAMSAAMRKVLALFDETERES